MSGNFRKLFLLCRAEFNGIFPGSTFGFLGSLLHPRATILIEIAPLIFFTFDLLNASAQHPMI